MTGPAFNPRALLAALDHHLVEYVVVGGYAANVHGAVRPTKDIDVARGDYYGEPDAAGGRAARTECRHPGR